MSTFRNAEMSKLDVNEPLWILDTVNMSQQRIPRGLIYPAFFQW